jgi:hypothetical protein
MKDLRSLKWIPDKTVQISRKVRSKMNSLILFLKSYMKQPLESNVSKQLVVEKIS